MNLFATATVVKILEVSSAFYPEKNGIFNPSESFILPSQNTTSQFGGGIGTNYVCGPSPYINTMNCFSSKFTHFSQSVPVPGSISTTPLFVQNSWIIGTSKGFLFRVKTNSKTDTLPSISALNTELWGSASRQVMDDFVPSTIYKETQNSKNTSNTKKTTPSSVVPENYVWIFPSSSPFIGTPIVHDNMVFGVSANQSLQAVNFETGKLVWSAKLSPDRSFYLQNSSLSVQNSRVYIGGLNGQLLIFDAMTGNQINILPITKSEVAQDNRFTGVLAAPLVSEKSIIVVDSTASTQKISLDSYETLWTYPESSVIKPLLYDSNVILTTTSGKIVSLNEQNGFVNWSTKLDKNSPLVDTIIINNNKTLLVATKSGELIALDANSGKILAQNHPIGTVIGSFFELPGHSNAPCLSFSTGSFRCFRVKI